MHSLQGGGIVRHRSKRRSVLAATSRGNSLRARRLRGHLLTRGSGRGLNTRSGRARATFTEARSDRHPFSRRSSTRRAFDGMASVRRRWSNTRDSARRGDTGATWANTNGNRHLCSRRTKASDKVGRRGIASMSFRGGLRLRNGDDEGGGNRVSLSRSGRRLWSSWGNLRRGGLLRRCRSTLTIVISDGYSRNF